MVSNVTNQDIIVVISDNLQANGINNLRKLDLGLSISSDAGRLRSHIYCHLLGLISSSPRKLSALIYLIIHTIF